MNDNLDFSIPCWYRNGCNMLRPNCPRICHRYLEMNCLINNCGMKNAEKYLQKISPQKIEVEEYSKLQQIKDNAIEFVSTGKNLCILSVNPQTYKTTWALKIMYKYFDEVWSGNGFRERGYFIYVPEFLNNFSSLSYRDSSEYKYLDRILKTVDIVIWDDIFSRTLTEKEQSVLNMYIDKRIMNDKTNIFTGYVYPEDKLNSMFGAKLVTRLDCSFEKIVIKGTSRTK